MLCYRCNHRADYLETGIAPRWECSQPDMAVTTCYMYKPTLPVVVQPIEGETRPLFDATIIAGRMEYVRVAEPYIDIKLKLRKTHDDKYLTYWDKV